MEMPLDQQIIQNRDAGQPAGALANPPIVIEDEMQWPKPQGWDFQPGQAAYNGKVFDINRKKKELLERFVRARGLPLTIARLRADVWPDNDPEDSTIRGYVCELRKLLREGLKLEPDYDPLVNVDAGAYRLLLR